MKRVTQNNGTNDVQQNATSSNDSTPQQQAAPQQNNTQSEAASNSSSNNSTHSSNWLTKTVNYNLMVATIAVVHTMALTMLWMKIHLFIH